MTEPPKTPAAREIAQRTMALVAVLQRASLESHFSVDRSFAEDGLRELQAWVAEDGILDVFAADERSLYTSALGTWPHDFAGSVVPRLEALGTLLWGASVLPELPPYGTAFEWSQFTAFFDECRSVEDVEARLQVRDGESLLRVQMTGELWLWRARIAEAERQGMPAEERARLVVAPAKQAVARGFLDELVEDDLAVAGQPFFRLSPQRADWIRISAFERNLALLWLLGVGGGWAHLRQVLMEVERRGELTLPSFAAPPPGLIERKRPMRSEEEIAARSLSLAALIVRSGLEQDGVAQERPEMARQLVAWIRDPFIAGSITQQETDLIVAPLGSWSRIVIENVSWRFEALGIVLWSMSMLDSIPPYDQPFSFGLSQSGALAPVSDFLESAVLRDRDELMRAFLVGDVWYWRARIAFAIRQGVPPPQGKSYREMIKEMAWRAYEANEIARPVEDDFPLSGRAYAQLSDSDLYRAQRIAFDRFATLNWMFGNTTGWEESPDTI
jgi:hypothetical protein